MVPALHKEVAVPEQALHKAEEGVVVVAAAAAARALQRAEEAVGARVHRTEAAEPVALGLLTAEHPMDRHMEQEQRVEAEHQHQMGLHPKEQAGLRQRGFLHQEQPEAVVAAAVRQAVGTFLGCLESQPVEEEGLVHMLLQRRALAAAVAGEERRRDSECSSVGESSAQSFVGAAELRKVLLVVDLRASALRNRVQREEAPQAWALQTDRTGSPWCYSRTVNRGTCRGCIFESPKKVGCSLCS